MSDGIAMKAEFADRIDKLTELAECERQVQAAAHRYEAAEMALVSAAEDLQEWSNQWSKCRENVIRALPDMLTADALTWYGSGSRLGDANAFIRRYCDDIEARRQAHGWPAAVTEPEPEPEPQDDASEFAEEGYAPVTKPYRVIADEDYERVTYDFATMAEATACYDEFAAKPITRVDLYVLHEDGHGLQEWVKHSSFCKPASLVEAEQTREPVALAGEWVGMPDREHPAFNEPEPLADPIWNEPAPTKPEADAIAKAVDWYDPKAVAERNRFDPFRMFRRETEDA